MARACARLQQIGGNIVACRKCDACIAQRIRSWTVRAIMEKNTSPFTYVLTLTYSEETQADRIGARAFRYSDVSDLMEAIRNQPVYTDGEDFLRCLVGGEVGSRHERVHYHVPLFSSVDVTTLGEWRAPWGVVTAKEKIVSPADRPAFRCEWSLWPHGFVTVQEPDYDGMRYAIAYAVKDQFNIVNSEGTGRQAKAEFVAAAKFRQSKAMPIGMTFVHRHLDECAAGGFVLPTAKLSVEGLKYSWSARGIVREALLDGYRQINDRHRTVNGRDCAAWSALVQYCRDSEKDLGLLGQLEVDPPGEGTLGEAQVAIAGSRFRTEDEFKRKVARRCGSTLPCRECLKGMGDQGLAALGLVMLEGGAPVLTADFLRLGGEDLDGSWRETVRRGEWSEALHRVRGMQWDGAGGAGVNPDCAMRGSKLFERVFPVSDAAARAERLAKPVDDRPVLGPSRYARRHKPYAR